MYSYDDDFYDYIADGASYAAGVIVPALLGLLPEAPRSVLDVGCGQGAWLAVWHRAGVVVHGIDGDYVDRQRLLVDQDSFSACDLRQEFELQRRFDLVQCLEVAEHLPPSSAGALVASLCRHSDMVLFSAAPPGQGGENHVNEQSYGFWRDRFAEQGFQLYDPVRRLVLDDAQVKPWYRYNPFLYLREGAVENAHRALAEFRLAPGAEPPDLSPRAYRLRKRLVALLPVAAMTGLATAKKTLFNVVSRS
jgi:SAM-dependent methyltransferase